MMDKESKTVLVISYYWPPQGGTGVYRISKFVKYLQRRNWTVLVLTASAANEQTGENIFRVPGKNILRFLPQKKTRGEENISPSLFYEKNKSLKLRLMIWLRLNLLVPDAKIGWYSRAVKAGKNIIANHNPSVILSTSPPPTSNLVAKKLAAVSKLPWVADFRDPWTNIYYYEAFPQGWLARKLNKYLENRVLQNADSLTVVNNGFFDFPPDSEIEKKCVMIPNGFDPEDFSQQSKASENNHSGFTCRYLGTLKMNQYAPGLVDALKSLGDTELAKNNRISFEFYGNIDPQYRQRIEESSRNITFKFPGLIPHSEAIRKMQTSDMLMLIIGSGKKSKAGFSTKLFEYIFASKPILAIARPDGAAAQLIEKTKTGFHASHGESEKIFHILKTTIEKSLRNETITRPETKEVQSYNFENLTTRLERVLLETIRHKKRNNETGILKPSQKREV